MDDSDPSMGSASDGRPDRIARAVRGVCLLGLCFLAGGFFGHFDLQPVRFMGEGLRATATLIYEYTQTRPALLAPVTHPGEGVVAHDPARASAGLTLVQGHLPGGPQVRLIDMAGREIHRWDVDFFAAWDEADHVVPAENVPKSRLRYHTQGFAARPDGSLLVLVGSLGAINLSRCGEVLWTVDRMVHHAVTPAPDGGYWVPSHTPLDRVDERLLPPGLSRDEALSRRIGDTDGPAQTLLKIDRNGVPVREISVLAALYDAGLEAALSDAWRQRRLDPVHLNDIELVTPGLAARLPGVEPRDLLISLRTMNMLAILDADDGALKWYKRGPWVWQHDPDITPDGRIELYNNRSRFSGRHVDGSQIVAYDPATDETSVLHPKGREDRFHSSILGSHQRLPNGNRLIVESRRGRVFEVTPGGEIVWSYVLRYDAEHAALIEHAERVPADYFTEADWTCDAAGE